MKIKPALLLLASVVLVGCGSTATPAPASAPPAASGATQSSAAPTKAAAASVTPLVVTSGGVNVGHAPLYIGMEKGIFSKYGLDVKIRQVASGFEALSALQTGDAQVADAVVAVAAQAAQQGVEVTAVVMANGDPTGAKQTDKYFAVVARKESGARAGHIEDLKGKKIGVTVGSVGHQYLFYALKANRLDATKDVTLQNVNAADLPSALQSGSVDAIVCWEPVPMQALTMVKDSVEVYRGGNHIEYLFERWMSPKFIQEKPAVTKAFVTAWADSAQYTRKNTDEAVGILAKSFPALDKSVIKTSLGYLNFDPRFSNSTQQSAQQGLEFARAVGALKGEYDFSKHLNLQPLNDVVKEKPELFADLPAIPANLQAKP